MECFLQYWDDLDDLYWIVAARSERILTAMALLAVTATVGSIAWLGAVSAIESPQSGLVAASLLGILLLTLRIDRRLPNPD